MRAESSPFIFIALILIRWVLGCSGGFVFISGDDSDDIGHCETASSCAYLIVDTIRECITSSTATSATKDVLAIGIDNTYQSQAFTGFKNWQSYLGFSYDIIHSVSGLTSSDLSKYKMIFLPSDEFATSGGIPCSLVANMLTIKAAIATYVNTLGGSLMTLVQGSCSSAYAWLPNQFSFVSISESNPVATTYLQAIVPALTSATLSHCCYHIKFTGPVGYNGLNGLALDPTDSYPIIIGGLNVKITNLNCGDGTHANDPLCAETQCFDGLDNNKNGFADCLDPNCQLLFSQCAPTAAPTYQAGYEPTYFPTPAPSVRLCQGTLYMAENTQENEDYRNTFTSNTKKTRNSLYDPSRYSAVSNSIEMSSRKTVVMCEQYRGTETFPLYFGQWNNNGTVPSNSSNITATVIRNHWTDSNRVKYFPYLADMDSTTFLNTRMVQDMSVNCALYGNVNYNNSQLLPVHGLHSGPDHNFVMFQHFNLSHVTEGVLNRTYAAMLFMKGAGAGGSGVSTVRAATNEWLLSSMTRTESAHALCPSNSPVGADGRAGMSFSSGGGFEEFPTDTLVRSYAHPNCTSLKLNDQFYLRDHVVQVDHVNGWTAVNITNIFHCVHLFHQRYQGSADSSGMSLSLIWSQEDSEIDGQVWHSSASGDNGPHLMLYSD